MTPHFAEVFYQLSDDYYKLLGDAQAAEAKSTMCEKASGSDCIFLCEDFSRAHNQQIENKFRIKFMPENDVLIFYARLRKHKN